MKSIGFMAAKAGGGYRVGVGRTAASDCSPSINRGEDCRTVQPPGNYLICQVCGHGWFYKGKAKVPTCPSCGRKTERVIA